MLAAQEANQEIHEELRGLLSGIETAINAEKYGDLAQYFHEDLRITTITQEVMSSRADIEPYFDFWFGEGGSFVSLQVRRCLPVGSVVRLLRRSSLTVNLILNRWQLSRGVDVLLGHAFDWRSP